MTILHGWLPPSLFQEPQDAPLVRQAVIEFNSALGVRMTQMVHANPGVRLQVFDLYAVGHNLHDQPERYGLTNVRDLCVVYDYTAFTP